MYVFMYVCVYIGLHDPSDLGRNLYVCMYVCMYIYIYIYIFVSDVVDVSDVRMELCSKTGQNECKDVTWGTQDLHSSSCKDGTWLTKLWMAGSESLKLSRQASPTISRNM